jgi:hypothetical protein
MNPHTTVNALSKSESDTKEERGINTKIGSKVSTTGSN